MHIQKDLIMKWKGSDPIVSICCLTYNHEMFLTEALKSFLSQKTDFPFEVLIHDDASTDNTAKIIQEYQEKYPLIIKPIYQSINQFSQGNRPGLINMKRSKAKYIALCEGDDFWRDNNKLQAQFNFMESHSEYSICYHDSIVIDQSGKEISRSKLKDMHKKDASSFELKTSHKVSTQTIFFRNIINELPREYFFCFGGDKFLCSFLGGYGAGKYLANINKSAFRVHSGGINRGVTDLRKKYTNHLNTRLFLFEYYNRIGDIACQDYFLNEINRISFILLFAGFSKVKRVIYLLRYIKTFLLSSK